MTSRLCRWLAGALAASYFVVHLPFLAPSLEDIDSINFALGLRDFDVARHQPHPPGYPVYIALGRLALSAVESVASGIDRVRAEAMALAIWSAVAGALAIAAAHALYQGVGSGRVWTRRDAVAAVVAATLLALAPLFWISGLRPMSDLPGLALALGAQALLVAALSAPGLLVPAAFLAAMAIGVRVQSVWLTLPLLAAVVVMLVSGTTPARATPLVRRDVWRAGIAGTVGVGLWLAPLIAASGGPGGYWRALGAQAGEDFAWVDMLWANPAPRRIAVALYETFVMPWGSIALASAVGAAALVGLIALLRRDRRAVLLMAAAFAPYAVFHLLFQETRHVRYALPLLPAVAWLAAHGLAVLRPAAPVAAVAICGWAAWVAIPGMIAYGAEPHPAFRAIADMSGAAALERPAAVFAHYSVRRPLQAQPPAQVRVVEPPRTNEWTGVVDYWRNGGTAPVWFLADPRRTDLAVIDPQSRADVHEYRWRPADRLELSGARPLGVDWYRLPPPGWFVGEGWSLTPELGGMTRLSGSGVDRRPIEAWVRRRGDALLAVVGARHLGAAADEAIVFTLAIDGTPIDEWALDPARGPNALRVIELPPGTLTGDGPYARVAIAARSALAGRPTPAVAIRQFDIQPVTGLIVAFDEGWHEEEFDNATGLRWRWTSGRSVLRLLPPRAVRIRMRGESPLKYVREPPSVRARAGDRVLAEIRPSDDFEWTFDVTNDDAQVSEGRIAIETFPVYLPGVAEGTVDTRQLGLRLFDIDVHPVAP